jgi:hypothetical protein
VKRWHLIELSVSVPVGGVPKVGMLVSVPVGGVPLGMPVIISIELAWAWAQVLAWSDISRVWLAAVQRN